MKEKINELVDFLELNQMGYTERELLPLELGAYGEYSRVFTLHEEDLVIYFDMFDGCTGGLKSRYNGKNMTDVRIWSKKDESFVYQSQSYKNTCREELE